jgi:hypothetical protein
MCGHKVSQGFESVGAEGRVFPLIMYDLKGYIPFVNELQILVY